jgi:spore coat protein A
VTPSFRRQIAARSSDGSRAPRRSAIAVRVACLSLVLLEHGCDSDNNRGLVPGFTLLPQTKLDGKCVPKFAISLPVFGPAGSIPRVDAAAHTNLTVTMMETNQQVLPPGNLAGCGAGSFRQTRVWTYRTTDSSTGAVPITTRSAIRSRARRSMNIQIRRNQGRFGSTIILWGPLV